MLAKLAFGNIRRNFRTYWSYFFSAAFSVFVLYLFLSVVFGKATATATAFQATRVLFGIGAVLTGIFAAFFIWYSNSFFIKSRKKEFATYMLLGMSKRQTVRLSILENLMILALAYAVGIAAGMLFNKLLIMLLFYIMHAQAEVPFEICLPALSTCSFVYLGVFLLIVVHSAMLLNKNSLISLITASKKAERSMRVSALTWVVGILAVVFMGLGYLMAIADGANIVLWPLVVLFVCVGTALLFLGLATLFFHFMRKNEAGLYRGTRLVTVSQLMHRYRGNVGALSVIAITTSVALCAVMCCCGLGINVQRDARNMRPFSAEYVGTGNGADAILNATLKDHPEVGEKALVAFTLLKIYEAGVDGEKNAHLLYTVIGESKYNEIMRAQSRREVAAFGADQCILVRRAFISASGASENEDVSLALGGEPLTLAVRTVEHQTFCSDSHAGGSILVVQDAVFDRVQEAGIAKPMALVGLMLRDDNKAGGFVGDLGAAMPEENRLATFYKTYEESFEVYGVLMFVGVFVGLLFIVATGSILYFRMAMEANEDRDRFVTLARIGMSAKELRSAIAKSLGIIFGAPLVVAAVNTLVAMAPLERLSNLSMTGAYCVILAVYAALYALYYLLTVNRYVKTVSAT